MGIKVIIYQQRELKKTMPATNQSNLIQQASQLIEMRTGLSASFFQYDLPDLLERFSQGDIAAYLQQLESAPLTRAVWQKLINALTIGETYFMRGQRHFRLLRERIIPQLSQNETALNIWSAGCATGEEAYSLAITLHETAPQLIKQRPIIASDLNSTMLAKAHEGIYRKWSFRHTDELFIARYFEPAAQTGYYAQLKSFIRRMVRFYTRNLLDTPPIPQAHIIFCRNVLLYFSEEQVERVEDILYNALAPGGWLFLGESEALRGSRERWITHLFYGAVVYQKPQKAHITAHELVTYNPPEPRELEVTPYATNAPEPAYEAAVMAIHGDRNNEAEAILAALLALYPHHARGHTLLAALFANRQAMPEAHAHLDAALHADPLLADAHYLKALLYLESAHVPEAAKALQAALYCDSRHILAHFMQGNLQAQMGALDKAAKHWGIALEILKDVDERAFICDFNDMTAGYLRAKVIEQLEGIS